MKSLRAIQRQYMTFTNFISPVKCHGELVTWWSRHTENSSHGELVAKWIFFTVEYNGELVTCDELTKSELVTCDEFTVVTSSLVPNIRRVNQRSHNGKLSSALQKQLINFISFSIWL